MPFMAFVGTEFRPDALVGWNRPIAKAALAPDARGRRYSPHLVLVAACCRTVFAPSPIGIHRQAGIAPTAEIGAIEKSIKPHG